MKKASVSSERPQGAVCFAQVLNDELAEIAKLRTRRGVPDNSPPLTEDPYDEKNAPSVFRAAANMKLFGLAFSGGGIRSATFNLGILQGLAKHSLLRKVDYLSTVSGGGYIGAWFTSWIKRARSFDAVQGALHPYRSEQAKELKGKEAPEIGFLRDYSNYLTPRLGLFGADTWTAIAIYLRNLLLNQTTVVLALCSILILPRLLAYFIVRAGKSLPSVTLLLSFLPLLAVIVFLLNMRLLAYEPKGKARFPVYARQGSIVLLIVAPLLLFAWISVSRLVYRPVDCPWWRWGLWGGLLWFGIWVIAGLRARGGNELWQVEEGKTLPWAVLFLAPLAAGFVGGLLLFAALEVLRSWSNSLDGNLNSGNWLVLTFGAPLVLIVLLLTVTLHVGFMGRFFRDRGREWFGRVGAWLLICSLGWVLLWAFSVYAPLSAVWLWVNKMKWTASGVGLGWVISTLAGILAGKNPNTGSPESRSKTDLLLSVTPYVFAIGLIVLLSVGSQYLLVRAIGTVEAKLALGSLVSGAAWYPDAAYQAYWEIVSGTTHRPLLYFFLACAAGAWLMAWRVDLNEFSMQRFYRNRLVRCYLGASNKDRKPNPFTGLDQNDDLPLADLSSHNATYQGPYHLINSTLNLVGGSELAWQERKAEPFLLSPKYCGFDVWLEKRKADDAHKNEGAEEFGFRPTLSYVYPTKRTDKPGGFYVGTAMATSGAAVSPNMGYHSSPALAFLLTLFNVRLGFWAGNPRNKATWQKPGPTKAGLWYLLAELLGFTDDTSAYVYLSDGDHFENLAIYELVKRRCRFIIACDAGADSDLKFGDLANAIRKCRTDIGVDIEIKTKPISLEKEDKKEESFSHWHCAVGKIRYDLLDSDPKAGISAEPGILVYLKASLTGDESVDILNYKKAHDSFPHETTADQWFSESQFESYRTLGIHVIDTLVEPLLDKDKPLDPGIPLNRLFGRLEECWKSPVKTVTHHLK